MLSLAWSVAMAIVPLAALFLLFQLFLIRMPRRQVADIMKGTLIAAAGLFLFLLGIGIGLLPFGAAIGAAFAGMDAWLVVLLGAALGFVTTWGEPAVRILADQVEEATNGSIRKVLVLLAICLGVALWVGIGMLRIRYGVPLIYLIAPGYALVLGLLWLSDGKYLAIGVDAGGVATGPLANTFLLALAIGASEAMGGQDPIAQGFGLVALIALAPILSLMILGFIVNHRPRRKD